MGQSIHHKIGIGGLALSVLVCVASACSDSAGPSQIPKGLANCQGMTQLTVPPVDMGAIRDLAPLGSLNPPAHTLPTDHLYLSANIVAGAATVVVAVVAPGDMVISEVRSRSGGIPDYAMTFFPCADLMMYFSHLGTLSADLTAKIGPITSCDPPYTTGGVTTVSCAKRVEIRVTAGTPLGTMGGDFGNILDWGGNDRRVPPLAFINSARSYGSGDFGQQNAICPVDYFVPSVATALRTRFSGLLGKRTIEPVCGTIMQDVPNTAQGRWYFNDIPQDDPHLALAHDNVDPRVGTISMGTSVPSLPTNPWSFTPATSGRVNTDFPRVTADGRIYCYQTFFGSRPPTHALIQLIAPTRVRIEGVPGTICGDPSGWAFSAAAREFTR